MKQIQRKTSLVLGIALYTRGFCFALLHGGQLVNWGMTQTHPGTDANAWCIEKLKKLISQWKPNATAFEDSLATDSRRGPRLRRLTKQMSVACAKRGVKVRSIPRTKLAEIITGRECGTKYQVAEAILKQYPKELMSWMPPERKPWMAENPKIRVFDAAALALCASNR